MSRAPTQQRELEVCGDERESLLVAWLDELAFLAETEGFVPQRVTEFDLSEGLLRATVSGCMGDVRHLVKAVTLHLLLFAPEGNGWRARVVLDV